MRDLELVVEQHGAAALVTARGGITAANAGALGDALARCINDGAERIVVDLVAVTEIDVAGLRAVMDLPKQATGATGATGATIVVRSGDAVARMRRAVVAA